MFKLDMIIINYFRKLFTDEYTQFVTLLTVWVVVETFLGGKKDNDKRNNSK